MKKGGYQILDLKNKNLKNTVGMVYNGIYEMLEGTRKAILISGLQVDGVEYNDFFAPFSHIGSSFFGITPIFVSAEDGPRGTTLTITINDNDVVTAIVQEA